MGALNGAGQTNEVLTHGRISYGMAGTAAVPLQVDSNGVLAGIATTISKTIQTPLYAAASLASSTQALSSTISFLPSVKRATFLISHGRTSTAAFGTNGTEYRIEVSAASSGNDQWIPIASVLAASAVAASCAASAGGAAAGTSVINQVTGTAMVTGDIVVFTSGTIEWTRNVVIATTAQFTIQDPLTADHTAATGIFGGGELFPITLNVEGVTRGRVVINNNASGTTQAIVSRIAVITET